MHSSAARVVLTLVSIFFVSVFAMEGSVIVEYSTRLVRTKHSIIFACSEHGMLIVFITPSLLTYASLNFRYVFPRSNTHGSQSICSTGPYEQLL